ncbi:hypothetical protein [Amycolatopsis jejuensis]|uniref:hypothetical protein n=1 Tax=Amycolatopsis jejuensis TaxID=330084 RepID=UPI000527744A|nr:hypothetical protein [Amycolatopsis jejuensis]
MSEFVRELTRGIAAERKAIESAIGDEADGHRARLAELLEIARHHGIDVTGPEDPGESGR